MTFRLSLVLLFIALAVLAALQYRWIGQISIAERQRLERSVRESAIRFAQDFTDEVRYLFTTMQLREELPEEAAPIVLRYRDWAATANYPDLLRDIYLIRPREGDTPELLRVDVERELFEAVSWPPRFAGLQGALARGNFAPGSTEGPLAAILPIGRPPDVPGRPRGLGPGPDLIRPFLEGWLLVEMNLDAIASEILPDLVARHFSAEEPDRNYRVAVVGDRSTAAPIFTSGEPWSSADLLSPDYAMDLTEMSRPPGGRGRPGGPGGPGGPVGQAGPGGPGDRSGQRQFGGPGPLPLVPVGQGWRLLVKHEAGSLQMAVAQLRRRNLAISFGILLVLGAGAATAMISGQRAHALGALQMEFAAGMSHELRTPLAVIQSAAHNLRAGVVGKDDVDEYATIIQNEARRLGDMVEQVMAYAQAQSGRMHYDIGPVDVSDIVDRAVQNLSAVITGAGTTIERRIDPNLPPAMADAAALTQCLQNLLSNALKYGRLENTVRIEVAGRLDTKSKSILLSVADHGAGVPEADVPLLFAPFHRGSNATSNTPGNGLGLHLVQKAMAAQNGAIRYQRGTAGGAVFTLVIPAAEISV